MESIGDDAMKTRWTLSLAALALIAGIFPAFAQQNAHAPVKSAERQKTDKKIDAAAATPFVTKHQADILKGLEDKAEARNQDMKLADSENPGSAAPVQGEGEAKPADPNAPVEDPVKVPQKEEPKPEPEKPAYRLMGTVCGKGDDLAIFDKGGEWPAMLKEGDQLDEATRVVKIDRGHVLLERTVVVTKEKAQQETKENYELYAW